MMKKWLGIAALFAALALIAGCGDGSGKTSKDTGPIEGAELDGTENFWLATDDTGMKKWPNNRMVLFEEESNGTGYVRIFFKPTTGTPANNWRLRIYFTISEPHDIMYQCAWDKNFKWGRSSGDDNYANNTDGSDGQPIECAPVSVFQGGGTTPGGYKWSEVAQPDDWWGITEPGDATATKLDLASMRGICLQLPYADGIFTLNNVTFGP